MEGFVCVSVNYRLCGGELRGRFAFDDAKRETLMMSAGGNAVAICTCNRTELYYFGAERDGLRLFSEYSGVPEDELKRIIMIYCGSGAISHLFKVASGIDSMVVGEDEILGQLKAAYAFAAERGRLSAEMNLIFHSAVAAAKKIKTETELSRTAVSPATLAAKLAAHSAAEVSVLLIGATGRIGGIVLKNLLSYKNVTVTATVRSHNSSPSVFPDSAALTTIPYERRYEYVRECGCVISATSGPHFTLTADKLADDGRKRLFIDLAVPRDIDPKAAELKGVTLRDIDYFSELAQENNLKKQTSVAQAETIIAREIDELKKQLLFRGLLPESGNIADRLCGISAEELFYRLKSGLSYSAFEELARIVRELE